MGDWLSLSWNLYTAVFVSDQLVNLQNKMKSNIGTDSIGGGKAPKKSYIERINDINKMEMPKLLRNMRIVNIFLSVIQVIAGISGLFSFIRLNITGTLVSLYVIMFGLLFLLFECRLNRMEEKIRRNFGFLYSYKGRAAFIFFIGFLDFGMASDLGYIAGFLMCMNALINLLVMCRHPEFRHGTMSADADPTKGYSSGNAEAAKYLGNNPNMAKKATSIAFQAATAKPGIV